MNFKYLFVLFFVGSLLFFVRSFLSTQEKEKIWTEATSESTWSARYGHTSVVFDNNMWVIGGNDGSNSLRDVWYYD